MSLGAFGEELACRYLSERGAEVICRNWRCRLGEIDIVARDGMDLVFVEVKTRRNSSNRRNVFDNITMAKRAKLRSLAAAYLSCFKASTPPHRIDIIGVVISTGLESSPEIEHIEAAV